MANTKVTGDLLADGTLFARHLNESHGITTSVIGEGTNLFYTDTRVGTYLGTYLPANGYDTATNIIASIVDSAPVTLDTLNELAAALGDDPNFATTVTNSLAGKLPLTGGTLTGALSGTSANFSNTLQATSIIRTISAGGGLISTELQSDGVYTNNTDLYLYTPSGKFMSFWAGGSSKMHLNPSGNLSIGNTNDTYKLDVSGTGRFTGMLTISDTTEYLRSIQSGTLSQAQTWYAADGTTRRAVFGFRSGGSDNFTLLNERNGSLLIGTNDTTNLTIASTGAATFSSDVVIQNGKFLQAARTTGGALIDIIGIQGGNDTLQIKGGTSGAVNSINFYDTGGLIGTFYNGRLGINSTSPTHKVHINSEDDNTYALRVQGNTNNISGVWTGIGLAGESANTKVAIIFEDIGASYSRGKLHFAINNAQDQTNATPGNARLTITNDGYVGINKTSPEYMLTVFELTTNPVGYFGYSKTSSPSNGLIKLNSGTIPQYGSDVTGESGIVFGHSGGTGGVNFDGQGGYIKSIRQNAFGVTSQVNTSLVFATTAANVDTERMRITSTGGLAIGTNSASGTYRLRAINSDAVQGDPLFAADNAVYNAILVYSVGADGYNGAATGIVTGKNTSTNRSINAGGTINASGSDYAEYITKAVDDIIAKGDIVGINNQAKLTNIFADAISFAVKSTDPSYVGGDAWFNSEKRPEKTEDQTQEEFDEIMLDFESRLEIERAKVDRIAFSGQVPCNVYNAQVGDYIIPIETEDGKIAGQPVSNPTFEQYTKAVGKVWKIMEDGRAWISVKIG